MSTPSRTATARHRHMTDPDDARDLAFDWDEDERNGLHDDDADDHSGCILEDCG